MRYFAKLAYKGTNYCGWQFQYNGISVQEIIEKKISILLRKETKVIGCGRTDAGVHAKAYFLHFDSDEAIPKNFVYRLNTMLPKDIVFFDVFEVAADASARYDAYYRSYEYHISLVRTPFELETAWIYPYRVDKLNVNKMQESASLLLEFEDFAAFCKTDTDVKTTICEIKRAEWEVRPERLVFHISANRFLYGMVRLIVGTCVNVGLGKTTLTEVRNALAAKQQLKNSYSVPSQGLFLTDIRYPFIENTKE